MSDRKTFAFKMKPEIHSILKVQAAKELRSMADIMECLVMEYVQLQEEKEVKRKTKTAVKDK